MTILQDFLKDLAELVNIDAGTRNAAGVTKAAEIMKRHYESIGFHAELVDLSPDCGKALLATNRPGAASCAYGTVRPTAEPHASSHCPQGGCHERQRLRDR